MTERSFTACLHEKAFKANTGEPGVWWCPQCGSIGAELSESTGAVPNCSWIAPNWEALARRLYLRLADHEKHSNYWTERDAEVIAAYRNTSRKVPTS